MALFGFGKKNKDAAKKTERSPREEKTAKTAAQTKTAIPLEGFSAVLLGTRVTEKAAALSEKNNVYTFNVSSDANKNNVSDAIEKLYKVRPMKVRIVNIPSKQVFVRGKWGIKRGGQKAYVYLKKDDKIEIV